MPKSSGSSGSSRSSGKKSTSKPQSMTKQNKPASTPAQLKKEPGLFGHMAATAGGVAAGSVIGHGVSSALWGDNENEKITEGKPDSNYSNPCEKELRHLMDCVVSSWTLTECDEFHEALKKCKVAHNMQY